MIVEGFANRVLRADSPFPLPSVHLRGSSGWQVLRLLCSQTFSSGLFPGPSTPPKREVITPTLCSS